ncbi:16375_t:CDS:2, partial [Entrophospora sp. SA101]
LIFSDIYLSCVTWLSSRYVADINNANVSISTKYKGLLITRELCKAFIKNSTHINKLHINTESHEFTVSKDDYFDIPCFRGANKSLAYLQEFKCCGHYDKTKIFRIMSESCKNIQTLDVDYFLDNIKSAAADELALLIRNQKSLKSFTLATFYKCLLKIVSALSSQSKYLSHVEFKGIRFEKEMTFDSLVACKNLEVLKFNLCDYVTNHSIDSLSKTKFPKLHTLVFNVLHTLPSLLKDLIRNNHDSIKHLSLDWSLISIEGGYYDYEEESKIIEVIANYCSNIQILCAHLNTSQTVAIFAHCKQLENLTILGREPIVADDLLPDLGFWMPTKLKTLNIQAIWSFSPTSLQQFLEALDLATNFCKNLEVLKFNLCDYVTNHSIDSLSKTKFPKLHTLVFNVLHTLPSLLKDLIRNNHDSIKHLSLDWSLISIEGGYYDYEEESKIIEVIANYCSNIQILCAHLNTSQTVAIFAHCKQLENLTILGREPIVADDLLPDLGFWMPTKLKTLNIQAIWSFSPTSLQQFLDLIRNNHDSIKHLSLDWSLISIEGGYYDYEEESKIIEVIANYCSNIQILCAHLNTSQTVAIFAHCKQLENLTILGREPIVADDLLPDLGFWMPTKLKTLNIQAIWSFSPTSLQQFLEALDLATNFVELVN